MAYVLTAELHDEATGDSAFARNQAYPAEVRDRMPAGAFALATSDWDFNHADHRCPHDAWLESCELSEVPERTVDERRIELTVRLFGAYHDGNLTLRYRDVSRYRTDLRPSSQDAAKGHRDWRYDEPRATVDGRVEHEIEWWGRERTATWLIEAADVEALWVAGAPKRSRHQRAVYPAFGAAKVRPGG